MPPRTPIYRGHKLPGQVVSRGLTGPMTVQRVIQIGNVPPQEVVNTIDDRVIRGTLRFVPHGTDEVTEAAVGNLNGFYGYVDNTFGMAIGEYATGKPNITIEDVNGLRIRNYTTNVLTLDLSGNAAFTGAVTAASGAIGGWAIGGATLTGGDAVLSSTGVLTLGTGDDVVILSAADATYRIWVGDATAADAPFSVTKAGSLSATGATIEGDLTATTGELGDLDVTGALVLGAGGIVKSSNYVAGEAGWQISAGGSAEFQDITARGTLHTVVFAEHETSVVEGTLKIDASDAERSLAQTLVVFPIVGTHVLIVDRPMPDLFAGDMVTIEDAEHSTRFELTMDYAAGSAPGLFAENVAGDFDVTYQPGARLILHRYEGPGHLLLTADGQFNGPRYSVYARTDSHTRNLMATLGNLKGSYGIADDIFGLGVGDYDAGNYLSYDPTNGFVLKAARGNLQIDENGIVITPAAARSDERTLRFTGAGQLFGIDGDGFSSMYLALGASTNLADGGIVISGQDDDSSFEGTLSSGGWYDDAHWHVNDELRARKGLAVGYAYQGGSIARVPLVDALEVMDGDASIWDKNVVGTEALNEGDFSTVLKWAAAGDFAFSGGKAVYTHNTGAGSITQAGSDLAVPLLGNTWYRLTYTPSSISLDWDGEVAVDNMVAASDGTMHITPQTLTMYFRTVAAPTDFKISITSTLGGLSLDNLSLKPIIAGDLHVYGGLNIGTASGADSGDVQFSGDLESYKNSTTYPVYGAHFLTTQLTSTSWNGDAKTNANNGILDLSALFGVPAGVKAVLVTINTTSAVGQVSLVLKPDSGASSAPPINVHTVPNGFACRSGWVPCDANGDIYFEHSSGASVNVWIEIWGYAL